MKIAGIELFPIRTCPIKPGYEAYHAGGVCSLCTVIVRVNTDAGVSGLGEAASGAAYFNQTLGSMLDWLHGYAAALEGANPFDLVGAHRIMDRVSGEFAPGCQPARAAIDFALHDLAGKVMGRPVYELLGGAYRTSFDLLTSIYEPTPQSAVAASRDFVNRGYRGLKIKVGAAARMNGVSAETFAAETEKLIAVLQSVPDDVYVDADANQSWKTAKIAVRIMEQVLAVKFRRNLALEQPIHHLDLHGLRYIRDALKIPLILDESVLSPEAMLQIVRYGAADRIVLKSNRVGGLLPSRKIVSICEAGSIGVSIDTTPLTRLGDTANCHLAATIRDPYPVDVEGHLWLQETPFVGGLQLVGGRAHIPAAPGFGIELDETKLKEMLVSHSLEPR